MRIRIMKNKNREKIVCFIFMNCDLFLRTIKIMFIELYFSQYPHYTRTPTWKNKHKQGNMNINIKEYKK